MKDKIFFFYATKFGKSKLCKAPKILYAVYVVSPICKLVFRVLYPVMCLCTEIYQAIVGFPAIAVNLALVKLRKVPYDRQQFFGQAVFDDLCIKRSRCVLAFLLLAVTSA